MIATAAAGDRTAVAKLARQARVLHPQLLRALPRTPCLAQPYSHCCGDFNTLYACITPVSPTLRLGKVGWSRSPMADAVVAPCVPCFEEFGSCRRQGFDGSRLNSHLCGQETLAQPTFPSARYLATGWRCVLNGGLRHVDSLQKWLKMRQRGSFGRSVPQAFTVWLQKLPPMPMRGIRLTERHTIATHGIIFVRIDRNPGRMVAMFIEGWEGI